MSCESQDRLENVKFLLGFINSAFVAWNLKNNPLTISDLTGLSIVLEKALSELEEIE